MITVYILYASNLRKRDAKEAYRINMYIVFVHRIRGEEALTHRIAMLSLMALRGDLAVRTELWASTTATFSFHGFACAGCGGLGPHGCSA